MNPAEALRAARARVLQGWCHKDGTDEDGNVCALLALVEVTADSHQDTYHDAYDALTVVLPPMTSVAVWNDKPWQTAEKVASTMERAADRWEADHPDQVAPTVAWVHRELELVS